MTDPESSSLGKSPLLNRNKLRVCHIRALGGTAVQADGVSLLEVFDLGRLAGAFRSANAVAPQLATVTTTRTVELTGSHLPEPLTIEWQRCRLQVPSGGLVDVRLLATEWTSLSEAISLMEDLSYESLQGEPDHWDAEYLADAAGVGADNVSPFHQLVFVPDNHDEPDWETIQRLVYRADLDAIEEYSSIGHPDELNRRPGQLAAVGRFGSVLWGLQDYVESSLVVSAALTVAATSTVRAVQREARSHLQSARALLAAEPSGDETEIRRAVAELGVDLAIGAEAQTAISDLLPSLRVDSFHQALQKATDLGPQMDVTARLLDRLATAAATA